MPQVRGDFEVTVNAVANASGIATVPINGPGVGYVEVDSIALFVTPSPPVPQCNVYAGTGAVGRALSNRRAGDRGSFKGTNDRLYAGQMYTVQWTGAAIGATCTAVLRGTWVRNG